MLNINTNTLSQATQKNLAGSQSALSSAINRLSSGKRINSAADDAAGLAISTNMTSYVNALNQGVSNANNAISMIQTASGGLSSTTDNLQRVRQLAVQAADGSLSDTQRGYLQTEVTQRLGELDRVANQTTFNGQAMLSGSVSSVSFQIGAVANQTLSVDFGSVSMGSTGLFGSVSVDISTASGAQDVIGYVDTALDTVNTLQSTLGAEQNRFTSAVTSLQSQSTNLTAAQSAITDADFAQETANLSKAQVLQQAGISVLAQANSMPQQVLKLLG
ncbi:flagellin domain-containing protein [Caballeronia sp. LZ025]|jgi:flagellin|uniref:Flagellin n=1 Tax=Caballeronia grimmiae TaxID=1071679 RepID=A0A069NWV2_9BURK|nr:MULTISPECIES: flagellin domain-containing protein [Caballeronia]KDR32642.1 flagellin [Caballeronia grimmiae]MDR5730817.1 flagellin domain-containing protein [Caballeronia sp. LZ025]GGD60003.1 flagellin [Caballeronia grimmiae]